MTETARGLKRVTSGVRSITVIPSGTGKAPRSPGRGHPSFGVWPDARPLQQAQALQHSIYDAKLFSRDIKRHFLSLAALMLFQTFAKALWLFKLVPLSSYCDSDIVLLEDEALHDAAAYWAARIWHLEQKLYTGGAPAQQHHVLLAGGLHSVMCIRIWPNLQNAPWVSICQHLLWM